MNIVDIEIVMIATWIAFLIIMYFTIKRIYEYRFRSIEEILVNMRELQKLYRERLELTIKLAKAIRLELDKEIEAREELAKSIQRSKEEMINNHLHSVN